MLLALREDVYEAIFGGGSDSAECTSWYSRIDNPMYMNLQMKKKAEFTSQWHQDWTIVNAIYPDATGPQFVYIDAAANHFRYDSNTFFLDQCYGWKGICVEANSKYHIGLRTQRSCRLVGTCVLDSVQRVQFANHDGTSHVLTMGEANAVAEHRGMECTTLALALTHDNIQHVHYMSLDIEGSELKVLHGVDWNTTTFGAITVEDAGSEVRVFLAARGMEPVLCVCLDTLFVRVNSQEKERVLRWYEHYGSHVLPESITANVTDCVLGAISPSHERCCQNQGKHAPC